MTKREHLRECHSAKAKCIYCGTNWNDLNSRSDHGACVTSEERLRKPECMTAAQEDVLEKMTRMSADRDKGWVELYTKLFPTAAPIPTPRMYRHQSHRVAC